MKYDEIQNMKYTLSGHLICDITNAPCPLCMHVGYPHFHPGNSLEQVEIILHKVTRWGPYVIIKVGVSSAYVK